MLNFQSINYLLIITNITFRFLSYINFIYFYFIIFIFFFLSCSNYSLTNNIKEFNIIEYKLASNDKSFSNDFIQNGWISTDNLNISFNQDGSELYKNQIGLLWFKIKLPEENFPNPTLFIPNSIDTFKVYFKKRLIYDSDNKKQANTETNNILQKAKQLKFDPIEKINISGLKWHLIHIPEDYKNNDLYIHFNSNNPYFLNTSSTIHFGSYNSLINWIILKGSGRAIIGIFNLLIGLTYLLSFLIIRDKIFVFFGFLNLSLGVYFIIFSYPFQFIYSNSYVIMIIWEISILFSAIFIKFYFESMFHKTNIFNYWLFITTGFILSKFYFEGYRGLSTWTILLNIVLVSNLFITLYLGVRLALKKNLDALFFSAGIFIIFLLGTYNAFKNNFQNIEESNIYYGFFIVTLSSGFLSIKRHYTLLANSTKIELESETFRKKMAEVSLQKLTQNISPDFFIDSLNLINSHILKNPEIADEIIRHLSDCYRYLTDFSGEPLAPLKEEWLFIHKYMHIIKYRLNDTFNFSINQSHAMQNILIPPMILHFVIENIIKNITYYSKFSLEIKEKNFTDGAIISISCKSVKNRTLKNKKSFSIEYRNICKNLDERLKFYYKNVDIAYKNKDNSCDSIIIKFFHKHEIKNANSNSN